MRRLGLMATLVFGLSGSAIVAAQQDNTPEARALYDAGAAAFADGRFEDALSRWQEAYALSELPALRYNIGTAHDRLGHQQEAVEHYRAYLAAVENPPNLNYVRRRIEVLDRQVAESEEPSTAEPAESSQESTDIIAASSNESDEEMDSVSSDSETVEANPPIDYQGDADAESGGVPIGGIVMTAGGGALLVAALATGLVANGQYGDLDDACIDGRCDPERQGDVDQLRTMTLTTDILLIAGGAVTLGGVLWMILGGSDGEGDDIAIDVGPQYVGMRGRF